MDKKSTKKRKQQTDEEKGIQAVKNQIMESYQNGVARDQLENNRGVHTFNNQSK